MNEMIALAKNKKKQQQQKKHKTMIKYIRLCHGARP